MDIKNQLLQLYLQKGELITNLELMQARLNNVNQKIAELKNAIIQQKDIEKKDDNKKIKGKEKD